MQSYQSNLESIFIDSHRYNLEIDKHKSRTNNSRHDIHNIIISATFVFNPRSRSKVTRCYPHRRDISPTHRSPRAIRSIDPIENRLSAPGSSLARFRHPLSAHLRHGGHCVRVGAKARYWVSLLLLRNAIWTVVWCRCVFEFRQRLYLGRRCRSL